VHHFANETLQRDKKEAPALGRGLESGEETPKGGQDNGSHISTAGEITLMADRAIPWNNGV
jgi:hypothetical protein